jgi:Carboxypeptidase regulatory-like domain/TonB dependent receptor
MKAIKFLTIGLIALFSFSSAYAQTNGSIAGSVTDANGAVVVGAAVSVQAAAGLRRDVVTNAKGEYSVTNLPPGKYTVKVFATKFELYENTEVQVAAGEKNELLVVLTVGGIVENVDVSQNDSLSNEPDNNKDATVLKDKDLEALPDDPDELAAALQALAGASAGPNGGQIYIDGFTGGQLPSKDQIREIRINNNPFSAEFDRPGNSRIEILTRPGSDRFRGGVNGAFNDESLNSRNPFVLNRASSQTRRFGGNFGGPLKKGKSSFFVDVNHNSVDNNAVINAQILDPGFNIVNFREDIGVPTTNFRISPRIDLTLNDKNTAVIRYSYNRFKAENQGLGELTLPTRAFDSSNSEHELRVTETMIINSKTVNETRFEFSDNRRQQDGGTAIAGVSVASAFTGGGAQVGNSFNNNRNWEVNNSTSTAFGKGMVHSVKFGGRLRRVDITDRSENNYAGTFSFQGFGLAPGDVDACDIDNDRFVTSIEQYRCKVQGVGGNRYNPTQFTITTGNPELGVSRTDGALFISDDWKVHPEFLFSVGLRYENQTNIASALNFAPRLGVAWSPGATRPSGPKFVVRAGAGIFYDRFSENNTLQALRFNGQNQFSLRVSATDPDPARRAIALTLLAQPVFSLTGVTNVPTGAQVQAVLPSASQLREVSPTLQAPYVIQSVFSIEKSFSSKFTLSGNFQISRSLHQIRTRNINAPICPNFYTTGTNCIGAVRPLPAFTDILAYESSGYSNVVRAGVFARVNLSPRVSFFTGYNVGRARSNADTPVYAYDLSDEYARSGGNPTHNFNLFGNFGLPWGISLNPNLNYRSGTPFNITRGVDLNGDGNFNERPTFAQLLDACTRNGLTASFCDVSGFDPNAIVPKNFATGPSSFTVGLRVGKNFAFGAAEGGNQGGGNRGGGGGPGGGGNRGGGGGGQMIMMGGGGGGPMMMGGGPGGGGRRPYNLNLSVQVTNLFNTVNLNNPVGNLTSFRFGQSTGTSGGFGGFGGFGGGTGPNRRVELQARFSF